MSNNISAQAQNQREQARDTSSGQFGSYNAGESEVRLTAQGHLDRDDLEQNGFDLCEAEGMGSALVRRKDNAYVLGDVHDGQVSLIKFNEISSYGSIESFKDGFDEILQDLHEQGIGTNYDGVKPG